jgi:hypothetical protein
MREGNKGIKKEGKKKEKAKIIRTGLIVSR